MQRYFGVIRLATERLHDRFATAARNGAPVAIHEQLKSFTLDVTYALAFGHDLSDDAPVADLRPHIDRAFAMTARRINAPFPYWRRVKLPADRALDRSLSELRVAAAHFIDQGRTRMRDRPELREQPENFLEAMLAAQQLEGRFSEEELFGNTITMLLAGEDTTAATLAWTTWLLVEHPDVQEQLAGEAAELLGDTRLAADHESAAQFAFGDAVLREAMRLKPVAPMVALEAVSDAVVADVHVPAGTRLLLLTRHAALCESSPQPEAFDPARWLQGGNGRHDPKSFLAFGAGPRFCPGRIPRQRNVHLHDDTRPAASRTTSAVRTTEPHAAGCRRPRTTTQPGLARDIRTPAVGRARKDLCAGYVLAPMAQSPMTARYRSDRHQKPARQHDQSQQTRPKEDGWN